MSYDGQIAVRQALHGYVDGHRELWCSAQLKPRDSKSVLMYSDISSSGLQITHGGYLTGYPLPDSGLYAVARTWPAPEMQRPGAVWTHTLFIEFADVARIRDAKPLLAMFRRPESLELAKAEPRNDQSLEISVADATPLSLFTHSDEIWCRQVLLALYGSPDSKVVAYCNSENQRRIERVVLALWSQQWPRLRRAFRFCTLTSSDRSEPKSVFDLQVAFESERSLRSKFPSAIFSHDISDTSAEWLDPLLVDIEYPQATGLRDFLQQAGADQATGRRAFIPLARLQAILARPPSGPNPWGEAISIVQGLSAREPSKVTQLVVRAAVDSTPMLDEPGIEFVLENLTLLTPEQIEANCGPLGVAVWRLSPNRLSQLWGADQVSRDIARAGLATLDTHELLDGLSEVGDFVETIFGQRPDLLVGREIWTSNATLAVRAIQAAARDAHLLPLAVDQLIASQRTDLIPTAFEKFGGDIVWERLATSVATQHERSDSLKSWLKGGAAYPASIAKSLISTKGMNRSGLAAIARSMHPDLVPNDYGDDPWVVAARQAVVGGLPEDWTYLCSFLLARGFGPRSRDIAGLVELALVPVVLAATAGALDEDSWRLLVPHLPESQEWPSWDRRQRVLAGVGQLYVRRSLSPASFGRLGLDTADFTCLVSGAAKEWGGRGYLRSVRREFRESRDFPYDRRSAIEEAISWF